MCFICFIEVTFASPVSKVGAWNDPTGSQIQLLATNAGGSTIFGDVLADQGEFVGVSLPTNQIERALFQFRTTQGVSGFTIDDLTYAVAAAPTPSPIPEPASLLLLGTGVAGFGMLSLYRRHSQQRQRP
ncbi:MAG: PEP-CTERM sorting domain-containing protein [Candidatus Tectomicrobia bacterium]|uniref:PEP-CTERM sorting domain-containing protein n=1 Tax=Tectimicrobiota bacterium TaxID=2528274 RepID=A0A937W3C0_UNCTE|nr:PEP-CTERM sorting domain-containing protein [Candidatus Tectomicrobia bacterium]